MYFKHETLRVKDKGCVGVDYIVRVDWPSLVNTPMYFQVP